MLPSQSLPAVIESGHWLRDAKRRVKGVIVKDELTGLGHEFL